MLTFNTITIVGHVGARRLFHSDKTGELTMVKLSVATNRKRVDGDDETTWFDVLLWGKTAEYVAVNVDKGDGVICEGQVVDRRDDKERVWKDVHCSRLVKAGSK